MTCNMKSPARRTILQPSGPGLERSAADQTVVFVEGVCIDFDRTAFGPVAILSVLLDARYPELLAGFGVDMVAADPTTANSFKLAASVVDGSAGLGELNAPNPSSPISSLEFDVHNSLAHIEIVPCVLPCVCGVKLLDMLVTAADTLTGMAYTSAIDTNKRNGWALSWRRRADRNLIDANGDEAFLA
jgi:hypothetical protein